MVVMSQWGEEVMVDGVGFEVEEDEAADDEDDEDEDDDEEEEEEEEEVEEEEEEDKDVRLAGASVHCCSRKVDTCVSQALLGVSRRMRTRSKRESRGVAMAVLVDRSAARS